MAAALFWAVVGSSCSTQSAPAPTPTPPPQSKPPWELYGFVSEADYSEPALDTSGGIAFYIDSRLPSSDESFLPLPILNSVTESRSDVEVQFNAVQAVNPSLTLGQYLLDNNLRHLTRAEHLERTAYFISPQGISSNTPFSVFPDCLLGKLQAYNGAPGSVTRAYPMLSGETLLGFVVGIVLDGGGSSFDNRNIISMAEGCRNPPVPETPTSPLIVI